jgi:uncharacterized protein (TIGR00730 family)
VAAICVFCASAQNLAPEYLKLAEDTGAELATLGHFLVFGGGQVGMMGAVAKAARAAGGRTIGIVPEALRTAEMADLGSNELLFTATLADRKTLMIERSDAFLTLPGGLGTLDELFEVWTTASLGVHAKPVVVVNYNGFYDGMLTWLRRVAGAGMVRAKALESIVIVDSLSAALKALPR